MADPHSIAIRKVRVKNFRALELVEVRLSAITVLIGENNAGKTSFLDAIFAAIGNGVRHLSEEDIYLKSAETKHSSRNRLWKLSTNPFCHGLPGSM